MRKKVLYLLYEDECKHILSVAKYLSQDFQPIFFSCDYLSSYSKKNAALDLLSEFGFSKENFFDIKNELLKISKINIEDDVSLDLNFLRLVEKKFLKENLNEIILKDFSFNQIYNPRDYIYYPSNSKILLKKVELLLKKIIHIFEKHSIEFIYSGGTSNFVRNIILQMAKKKNLSYYAPSYRFGITFLNDFSKNNLVYYLLKKNIPIKEKLFKNLLLKFNPNKKIIIKNKYTFSKFIRHFSSFLLKFVHFINDYRSNYSLRLNNKKNYFFIKSVIFVNYFLLRNTIRKFLVQIFLEKCTKSFFKKFIKERFVFYPLHFLPEGGVFDHKELFDEFYLIQQISKKLPIDLNIVVKPHPAIFNKGSEIMDLNYYRAFLKIPNVQIVSPSVNSHYLIKKSVGIISVSSSVALESIIYKKNSINYAQNEFDGLKSIQKVNLSNLNKQLNKKTNFGKDLEIIKKLFSYGMQTDCDKFIYFNDKNFKKNEYMKLIAKYLRRIKN